LTRRLTPAVSDLIGYIRDLRNALYKTIQHFIPSIVDSLKVMYRAVTLCLLPSPLRKSMNFGKF
jgi:thiosulfate reductase cytochrome b subunit